jgi:hypothetical protein
MTPTAQVGLNGDDATAKKSVTTPKIAAVRLDKANPSNELRPKGVEELAQLATAGKFASCLPLPFDPDGCIQDGAHRLHASVESVTRLEFICDFSSDDTRNPQLPPKTRIQV